MSGLNGIAELLAEHVGVGMMLLNEVIEADFKNRI